jgi:hypothetical protein
MYYTHLFLTNRGLLITPFHNMMLIPPVATEGDIDLLIKGWDDCLPKSRNSDGRTYPPRRGERRQTRRFGMKPIWGHLRLVLAYSGLRRSMVRCAVP